MGFFNVNKMIERWKIINTLEGRARLPKGNPNFSKDIDLQIEAQVIVDE